MKTLSALGLAALMLMSACSGGSGTKEKNNSDSTHNVQIQEADARYKADSVEANSFVAYDENMQGARPVVLIVPEWWGLTEYTKRRARELAALGYFAMSVDMYGNRQIAEDPDAAGKLAGPFYADANLLKSRVSAALEKVKSYPQADPNRVAMMGYCFGGYVSLMSAHMGLPLKGVVSFHGGLKGTAPISVPVLILHGGADKFVPDEEVNAWKKTMDSAGSHYTFKVYPGATHAFTNPGADSMGRKFKLPIQYNPAGDTASWKEMETFFKTIF